MAPFDEPCDEDFAPRERRFLEDHIGAGECPECAGHIVYHGDGYHCAGCGWDENRDPADVPEAA